MRGSARLFDEPCKQLLEAREGAFEACEELVDACEALLEEPCKVHIDAREDALEAREAALDACGERLDARDELAMRGASEVLRGTRGASARMRRPPPH